jgi:hypothetical protein
MYGAAFGENKILYTGGVMFTLERAIQVFYPLVQSQDLDFVTGNTFWTWKKLSFHIDIDELRKSL